MVSPHPSIPALDLAGAPSALGAAHGEARRDTHITNGCACEGSYHTVTLGGNKS
jgi:hypothetical protein